jgi:hypothetical protein
MERFTTKFLNCNYDCNYDWNEKYSLAQLINRLGEYEDCGFTPSEMEEFLTVFDILGAAIKQDRDLEKILTKK